MKIGPVQFPSGGSIAGVAIISLAVSVATVFASNRVTPVRALIGPR